ncbi:MAG: hypothetical protein AUJ98_03590 [Bacteroidetes bacterium CG2_30_33_31]|nr:MAG: hypothetical protein AUJ98_03590 [Bacteroidetes bacterium CG2_30_33_31]
MQNQYSKLIDNLNAFIKKHYYNQLIRGLLYTFAIILFFFLAFDIAEYFFYFNKGWRIFVTTLYITISLLSFSYFIAIPLLRLLGIISGITHEKAAVIIGKHFPEINDKLLNTLQLYHLKTNEQNFNIELLNASIEQKALKLSPFRFKLAIDFSLNRKYIKFVIPPLMVLIILLISAPSVIINSTKRLINFDSTFVPDAPFKFVLLNKNLKVEENKDFMIRLRIDGKTVPEELQINIDGFEYLMQKENNTEFSFMLKHVKKNKLFYFVGDKYFSQNYELNLLHSPVITKIKIIAEFPKYLHKASEIFDNVSDISVPEGTSFKWNINTSDVSSIDIIVNKKTHQVLSQKSAGNYMFLANKIRNNVEYQLIPKNSEINYFDTLDYYIAVIKDEFPRIKIDEQKDSIYENIRYFKGFIRDDYGFSNLFFNAKFKNLRNQDTSVNIRISIDNNQQSQEFFYYFDVNRLNYLPGSSIEYSFVVHDNDGINGPKRSSSEIQIISTKTKDQQIEESDKREEETQKSISSNMKQAKDLTNKLEKISSKLKGQKTLSWQDKQEIKEAVNKYEKLQKEIEEDINKNKLDNLRDKESLKLDEDIMKKKEELDKLFDELITPEMKQLIEEMKKMLENNAEKEKVQNALDKFKMDSEYLKDQLERDLEIMKQLKLDQQLQQSIDKIEEIQKKQEDLANKSDSKSTNNAKNKLFQDSLNKEFDKFKEMMKEVRDNNSELENPNKLENTEVKENDISKEMGKSSDNLSKGNSKSASQKQKSASDKMKDLESQLKDIQASMESESNSEDMQNLKNILQNFIEISFNQEALMYEVNRTSSQDPKFPKFVDNQKRISNDIEMVADSLTKLAKRNPSISPFISKEIAKVNTYSNKTFLALKELNTIGPTSKNQFNSAVLDQQYIMTSVNNLSLMLNEVLDDMQKQQNKKSGKGACKKPKPGSGNGSKSMRQMQEDLQKQMEEMKSKLDKQGKKGENDGKGNASGEKMSEEFAKMAAQQEAIRKKLQEYKEKLGKEGRGEEAKEMGKLGKEMEKNETDLVNKILTAESLKRQKEILTRLLESEKSDFERDEKEERESKSGKDKNNGNKNAIIKYKERPSEDLELLKSIPPNLKPFYRNMVENFFNN